MTATSYLTTVATSAPVNEVQTLTITATGGTFTLAYDGGTATSALAYDITSANLKTALVATGSFVSGDLTVTGDGPHTITFTGDYAGTNVALLTLAVGSLTGGSASIVQTTPGSPRTAAQDVTADPNSAIAGRPCLIRNTGGSTVYLGDSSVTSSTGYPLAATTTMPVTMKGPVFARTADGGSTTVITLVTE